MDLDNYRLDLGIWIFCPPLQNSSPINYNKFFKLTAQFNLLEKKLFYTLFVVDFSFFSILSFDVFLFSLFLNTSKYSIPEFHIFFINNSNYSKQISISIQI